ncbi:hypothetical protein QR680_008030 [Steinernema hermaphroditum]|uniref:Geranylgeranyl transferase type-2 subunit alpha n=1 Tax=Steinernema hermaphroditum TaxID=289476 RepID=A0AA39M7C4_9BILA|nr:hypothetical protein QR680_008030 [Steinernema hermaphroditum]
MSHFVKKVPTTEEERAAIEAEKAKKLQILTALTQKIQKKVDAGELDNEFLEYTAHILRKNPNIQTLFNLRRDALLKMMERRTEESEEAWETRVGELCNVELALALEALKKDCKSYNAWFHRFWAFELHPKRDVAAEIANCDMALKLDQRNFHAWDHLRSVAKLVKLGSQEAVDFSEKRLKEDVSNYSAYHYRATELPNVKPDLEHGMKISVAALCEEIERLHHGPCFTEPKDQSPWRYALQLLDQATTDQRPAETVLLSVTTKSVVFSRPVGRKNIPDYVQIDDDTLAATRCPRGTGQFVVDTNWEFTNEPEQVVIRSTGDVVKEGERYVNRRAIESIFSPSAAKTPLAEPPFRAFMDDCDAILEVEPACFWPLYFKTECMEKLGDSMTNYDAVIANYRRMAELDPKRKNVYRFKASVLSIRKALLVDKHNVEAEKTQLEAILNGRGDLKLRGYEITDITKLYPIAGLITDLDLAETGFADAEQLRWMSGVEHVDLQGSSLEMIPGDLHLRHLTFLSLANTQIRTLDDVKAITCFRKLERLLICETKLVHQAKELQEFLASLRGDGETPIRVISHWLY